MTTLVMTLDLGLEILMNSIQGIRLELDCLILCNWQST
jgi:hypothetical protein